ncbi:MAG: CYTH domain-containing protein [Bacteroidales bacterium]|jgi:CYTH domain-containing protein|nr:CYTH domain-containing protein [Bacteroidales bacterium]
MKSNIEIERKFLVNGDFMPYVTKKIHIVQGYLNSDPKRTVRVRIKDDKGFITIKGIGNETGATRFEWEKEIAVEDAKELIKLCESGVIDKVRHLVPSGSHTIEVDVFYGENEGLVMAEIELASEDEDYIRPEWLGCEVTNDKRYYNSYLSKHPYTQWK